MSKCQPPAGRPRAQSSMHGLTLRTAWPHILQHGLPPAGAVHTSSLKQDGLQRRFSPQPYHGERSTFLLPHSTKACGSVPQLQQKVDRRAPQEPSTHL